MDVPTRRQFLLVSTLWKKLPAGGRRLLITMGIADPTACYNAVIPKLFLPPTRWLFDVAQQAARRMIDHGDSGSIINISSITGLCGWRRGVRAASKAAVAHLTKVQALECASRDQG